MGNVNTTPLLHEEERNALSADRHDYDFENLVFNGGGAKCIAQVGTLKVGFRFNEVKIVISK